MKSLASLVLLNICLGKAGSLLYVYLMIFSDISISIYSKPCLFAMFAFFAQMHGSHAEFSLRVLQSARVGTTISK